jgi:hypothetical protein
VRRPPSLARQLIQGLLLQPHLARTLEFPQPDDGSAEGATLCALVAYCAQAEGEPTPAGILQAFVETPHEPVLADVLAAAEDHQLDALAIEAQVRDGLDRWWQQARRAGAPAPAAEASPEEAKRLKQLDFIRQRVAGTANVPSAHAETDGTEQGVRREVLP